jgi:hypothetical protein
MATTFYAIHGTVARIVRVDDGMTVDIWSRTAHDWSPLPEILGYLTGAGGDPPADELSRDDARAIIDSEPVRVPARLDGPGSDPGY